MTISLLFVLIFTVVLLTFRVRNKLSFVFGGGFLAVDLLILSLMLYTIRINNYRYFFQFEFYIVKYLGGIGLSFYDIKTLMLIAIVAFLTIMVCFYLEGSVNMSFPVKRYKSVIAFIASAMLFVAVNSNSFAENMFLWKQYAQTEQKVNFLEHASELISVFSTVYIIAICCLPYRKFYLEYKFTGLFFKKKYIVSLMFALLFLQGIFATVLFLSPLRHFLMESSIYDLETASGKFTKDFDYYIMVITGALLTVLGFIYIKSQILSEVNIFGKRFRQKKSRIALKDVRHVFHTFKNLMALFLVLDNTAIENYGSDEGMECLLEIKSNVNDFSSRINRMLNINDFQMADQKPLNLIDCIMDAVGKLYVAKGIRAEVSIECEEAPVCGDRAELCECFANLLFNAAEAIDNAGEIKVKVWQEGKWICVSVRDNGCGIDSKLMKKLFKPFVSTKKTFNNWGIGLSHVKTVVDSNFGFIDVKSKPNEFTEFQIILPKSKQSREGVLR